MVFNPFKCKIIDISAKKLLIQRKYDFCGIDLEQVDSISYLGVALSCDSKWA